MKNLAITIFTLFFTINPLLSNDLKTLLEKKDFKNIKNLFYDSSWKKLIETFKDNDKTIIFQSKSYLSFFNFKEEKGEFGIITFKKKNNLFGKIEIFNKIGEFFYLKKLLCRKVKGNEVYKLNEAKVELQKGYFCKPHPSMNPAFFSGKAKFTATPKNETEKEHLKFLFKKPFVSLKTKLIFFWNMDIGGKKPFEKISEKTEKELLKKAKPLFLITSTEEFFLKNRIFFPVSEKLKSIMFYTKSSKLAYYNDNGKKISLFFPNEGKLLLDYEIKKENQIKLKSKSNIKEIQIYLTNKGKEILNVQETVYFKEKTKIFSFLVPENVKLRKISWDKGEIAFIEAGKTLFVFGTEPFKILSFNYTIEDKNFKINSNIFFYKGPSFFISPFEKHFYRFKLILPSSSIYPPIRTIYSDEPSFLTTKSRLILKKEKEANLFFDENFRNNETEKITKIIRDIINFYHRRFFKKEKKLYIIFSLWGRQFYNSSGDTLLVLIDNTDRIYNTNFEFNLAYRVYELLLRSFILQETYKDDWIIAGISTFMAIEYLKEYNRKGYEKSLKNIINELIKRWNAGPVIFGRRIGNWEESIKNYRAIIYYKPSIMLSFADRIFGEKTVNLLFNFIEKNMKNRVLSTGSLINSLKKQDKQFAEFLERWLLNFKIPELSLTKQNKAYIVYNNSELYLPLKVKGKFIILKPHEKVKLEKKPKLKLKKILREFLKR